MDSIQYGYLRVNKRLMIVTGQWPYQSGLQRLLVSIVFTPIVVGQMVLQGGGMITSLAHSDLDAFMEGFPPFIISWTCLFKFFNYMYNHGRMKSLLDVMQDDWRDYSRSPQEFDILIRNYEFAKRVSFAYSVYMYGSMAPFTFLPLVLHVLDYLGIRELEERKGFFRLEYLLDEDRYYWPLHAHAIFGTLGFITLVVGIDSMMVFYVQHECALCLILGERLKGLTEDRGLSVELYPSTKEEDRDYQNARNCILIHTHIVEFARSLEDANTVSFFLQLGTTMIGISFAIVQAVTKLDNPDAAFRHISFMICLFAVLLLQSWPGQQLSDHTDRIFEFTTSGKWYQTSMNARKLLSIMLLRSIVPIKLTAGKLYALNMENYSSVVRTSFSYFTVLCSFQ